MIDQLIRVAKLIHLILLVSFLIGIVGRATRHAQYPRARIDEHNVRTKTAFGSPGVPQIVRIGDIPDIGWEDPDDVHLQFADKDTGWLSDLHNLWRTKNGGRNWENQGGFFKHIMKFEFINRDKGWLLDDGWLFITSDGGQHWGELCLQPIQPPFLCSFAFLKDGLNGWAVGVEAQRPGDDLRGIDARSEPDRIQGVVYRTTDGGESWCKNLSVPGEYISEIIAPNEDEAWILCGTGKRVHFDGKWQVVYESTLGPFQSPLPYSEDVVITGERPSRPNYRDAFKPDAVAPASFVCTSGRMRSTNDLLKDTTNTQGIFFYDSANGWARVPIIPMEFQGGQRAQMLYSTRDGGVTWNRLDLGIHLIQMAFRGGTTPLIVAKEGTFILAQAPAH